MAGSHPSTSHSAPHATVSRSTAAQHPRPHHHVPDSTKTAGVVSRGVAAVLDVLTVGALMGAIWVGLALTLLVFGANAFHFPDRGVLFTATGFAIVSIAYNSTCWAVSGRTLGGVVMGLRVVNRKGERVRPVVAILRAAGYTFFAVGLLWVAIDPRRRSLQDIVVRTRVVYSR
ncbi:hypothetical protein GS4_14_00370 [Gordonia soli NBRC 108243]|uniref:RDD domain-containing protein n=1 Tax=Gordonia soli NBRC 108243 TaxID=1223545 RepID=M0QLC0_9ACTN|nr:hypothetical protein GS4_14_00370 [Gordonia soli NBRC 108243]